MPTVDEFRFARGTAPWLVGGSKKDDRKEYMYIELTVTAISDRDPSCNLFNLTEVYTFPIHEGLSATTIKEVCKQHKQKFIDAWPHNQYVPTLIPLDTSVRTVEGRRP